MIAVALVMTALGLLVGLFGIKLFRILLPLVGLVSGAAVGFIGFQGVFGSGAVSTTIAIFVAVLVGLLLAILSFVFVDLALTVYTAILGASALAYLGVALGVGGNGFVMFLLTVAGLIIGFSVAARQGFTEAVVVTLTSFLGGAMILAGVFLVAGDVTLEQLHSQGVIASILGVVQQSLLWLFVWLGGSLLLAQIQHRLIAMEVFHSMYEFGETSKSKV